MGNTELPQWAIENLHPAELCKALIAYNGFLEYYEAWKSDKTDFRASFRMLNSHPMFWVRRKGHSVTLNDAVSNFLTYMKSDGSICIELGERLLPDMQETGHDYRLTVVADTYEEAMIKAASTVDTYFSIEGIEREGVGNEY